jgi:hypothetical protein
VKVADTYDPHLPLLRPAGFQKKRKQAAIHRFELRNLRNQPQQKQPHTKGGDARPESAADCVGGVDTHDLLGSVAGPPHRIPAEFPAGKIQAQA